MALVLARRRRVRLIAAASLALAALIGLDDRPGRRHRAVPQLQPTEHPQRRGEFTQRTFKANGQAAESTARRFSFRPARALPLGGAQAL
jgi:hypothetical protein